MCVCVCVCVCACVCLVAQLCTTLWDPMDCSPPGSSACGDSLGKNTGVGCDALLQKEIPTQGSNPGLLYCRQILYRLSHQGSSSHVCTYMYLYIHTYIYTHTYILIHIYTYTYTHTHVHIHIYSYIYTYRGQEVKGTTEDEMAGWHHQLDGHGFE